MLPVRDVHILRWFMFIIPMWRGERTVDWKRKCEPKQVYLSCCTVWLCVDLSRTVWQSWIDIDCRSYNQLQWVFQFEWWTQPACGLRHLVGDDPDRWWLSTIDDVSTATNGGSQSDRFTMSYCSEHCITTRIVIYLMLLSVGTVHLFL